MTKTCTRCKAQKALSVFAKDHRAKDGHAAACLECKNKENKKYPQNPVKAKAYNKKYYDSSKGQATLNKNHLFARYGITPETYLQIAKAQAELCAICKKPSDGKDRAGNTVKLNVDHCHDSGRVRGLLCRKCNLALGAVNDSIDTLLAAIAYLEKHKDF